MKLRTVSDRKIFKIIFLFYFIFNKGGQKVKITVFVGKFWSFNLDMVTMLDRVLAEWKLGFLFTFTPLACAVFVLTLFY